MNIIEINALDNGAHRNQNGNLSNVPEGWAIIPDDIVIPDTFPFVNIEVEDNVVISMTAGIIPEVEEDESEPTAQEDTAEMLIDHEYRITLLELGITE